MSFRRCLHLLPILIACAPSFDTFQTHDAHDQGRPIIRISPIEHQNQSDDIAWVAITAERKLVELFATAGTPVVSELIRQVSATQYDLHISGRVIEADSSFTITVDLFDGSEKLVSSAMLTGGASFFRRIRNVMGETLTYALHLDPSDPSKEDVIRKPTDSNHVFALYLLAKRKFRAERTDAAIQLLEQSIESDSSFALAYWTISQIYSQAGNSEQATMWQQKATAIDRDHPQWPFEDPRKNEQPLLDLLVASRQVAFTDLDIGLRYKRIDVERLDLTAAIWIIDPKRFEFDIQMQRDPGGNYLDELSDDPHTILSLNGGFFEMDCNHHLTPSGLVVKNNRIIHSVTDYGGSGVFFVRNGNAGIAWSKDVTNPEVYDLALQSGPVIVEHGGVLGIYSNDYNRLNRSAVGLADDKIVLAIVAGEAGRGLSLYEFADFLRISQANGGAGCDVALNLDGGSSSQVHFRYNDLSLAIQGLWRVNNAIVVNMKN